MRTCETVPAVTDRMDHDDPRLTAHRMPAEMATQTLMDLVGSARALEAAILNDEGEAAILRIRETASAQAEAYMDLTAEAATHARALKP